MAVIETPDETVQAAAARATPTATGPTGFAGVLGSADHKVIGRLYAGTALLFSLFVLAVGLAFAVEAIDTDSLDVFGAGVVFQAFTFFRVGLVFLIALPLTIGVALVVVPLQVGARTVAFPRAAAASYWAWLVGSLLLISSYLMDGGPGGGRTEAVDLWIAAMGVLVLAVLTAAMCLATTVLALRTPGLRLSRTPLFAWSVLVASVLWLLTLPVMLGVLVLIFVDHQHAAATFGSDEAFFTQLAWVFRNPQIYTIGIPVLGFAGDVLVTSSKRRLATRNLAIGAIGTYGVLGFGAFLVTNADKALDSPLVIVMGVFAVLPVLLILALAGELFKGPNLDISGSVLYALSAMLILLLGTAAGALGSIPSMDTAGTIYDVGVNHAIVLAALIAGIGGLHWWATKVLGHRASEPAARLAALILLIGSAAVVFPDLISGLFGTEAELAPDWTGGMSGINAVIVIGALAVALGLALGLAGLMGGRSGDDEDGETPADPWSGQTLEWLSASPPPLANFTEALPVVTSAEPLYDLREES